MARGWVNANKIVFWRGVWAKKSPARGEACVGMRQFGGGLGVAVAAQGNAKAEEVIEGGAGGFVIDGDLDIGVSGEVVVGIEGGGGLAVLELAEEDEVFVAGFEDA